MTKTMLQGTIKEAKERRKSQREDNVKEYVQMGFWDSLGEAEYREKWNCIIVIVATSTHLSPDDFQG